MCFQFGGASLQAAPTGLTVSVDQSRTHQTMDGCGSMHPIHPWENCNPFCSDADISGFLDSLINVVGMTLHRYFLSGCKFSPSPGTYVIDETTRFFFEQAQTLDSIARANNEFYGTCPAVLGPPSHLLKSGKCAAGFTKTADNCPDQTIYEDKYDEFGEFCATFLQTVVDSFGITPYAFSFQNEPCFCVTYPSAVYQSAIHYRDMFRVAAPIVGALGLPTLIYTTEHMAWNHPVWENALRADPVCAPYVHRDAIHAYMPDAVTFDPAAFGGRVQPVEGTPLWMSESPYKGDVSTYEGAIHAAKTLVAAFKYSSMSAWIHLGIMANRGSNGWQTGLADKTSGARFPTYWVTAQYWRFIRPGMQRIEAQSGRDSVEVIAFKDDRVSSMSIIMLNETSTDHTVELSITGGDAPPRFDLRRTTESENFVMLGTVAPTATIDLPGRSVVSLGYNYIGTGVPPDWETSVAHPIRETASGALVQTRSVRVYDLRGRLVSYGDGPAAIRSGAVSAAAYCVDNGRQRSLMIAR